MRAKCKIPTSCLKTGIGVGAEYFAPDQTELAGGAPCEQEISLFIASSTATRTEIGRSNQSFSPDSTHSQSAVFGKRRTTAGFQTNGSCNSYTSIGGGFPGRAALRLVFFLAMRGGGLNSSRNFLAVSSHCSLERTPPFLVRALARTLKSFSAGVIFQSLYRSISPLPAIATPIGVSVVKISIVLACEARTSSSLL